MSTRTLVVATLLLALGGCAAPSVVHYRSAMAPEAATAQAGATAALADNAKLGAELTQVERYASVKAPATVAKGATVPAVSILETTHKMRVTLALQQQTLVANIQAMKKLSLQASKTDAAINAETAQVRQLQRQILTIKHDAMLKWEILGAAIGALCVAGGLAGMFFFSADPKLGVGVAIFGGALLGISVMLLKASWELEAATGVGMAVILGFGIYELIAHHKALVSMAKGAPNTLAKKIIAKSTPKVG